MTFTMKDALERPNSPSITLFPALANSTVLLARTCRSIAIIEAISTLYNSCIDLRRVLQVTRPTSSGFFLFESLSLEPCHDSVILTSPVSL